MKKRGKKEKNSGEDQNRVGFCTRSCPGGRTCGFPPLFPLPVFRPSQLLLFLDKWVRQKGIISGNFTLAGGEGDGNKDGFKKMLAAS